MFKLGHFFFAVAMAVFGIHLIYGNFEKPAPGPPWTPQHLPWIYVTAIVLIAGAVGIAANKKTRWAALLVGAVLLLRVLFFYGPKLVANPHDPGPWTSGSELLAMCGAALVLAGITRLGRLLFALPLIVFGVQHFMYARFVATFVPPWIPGRLFWAYFVGAAFIAAAVAIMIEKNARLAATLLGLMFLSWVLILHLPRVAAAPHDGKEWTSAFVALAMSGGAFIIAETFGRTK